MQGHSTDEPSNGRLLGGSVVFPGMAALYRGEVAGRNLREKEGPTARRARPAVTRGHHLNAPPRPRPAIKPVQGSRTRVRSLVLLATEPPGQDWISRPWQRRGRCS
jgi:hypothetical protein